MSDQPQQTVRIIRLHTTDGCPKCDNVKEAFKDSIAKGEVELVNCNINDPQGKQLCLTMIEKGIIAFPTLETDDGKFCLVVDITEEGEPIIACGPGKGKYPIEFAAQDKGS